MHCAAAVSAGQATVCGIYLRVSWFSAEFNALVHVKMFHWQCITHAFQLRQLCRIQQSIYDDSAVTLVLTGSDSDCASRCSNGSRAWFLDTWPRALLTCLQYRRTLASTICSPWPRVSLPTYGGRVFCHADHQLGMLFSRTTHCLCLTLYASSNIIFYFSSY